MKNQRLTFASHGNPSEVLSLKSGECPALNPGEVLLAVQAAPINPADLNFIEGTYGIKPTLPASAGMECSAVVIDSRSDKFSCGDTVIPIASIGSWAKYAISKDENLIGIPPGIDPLQSAMLKVNPATAWLLLHDFENLQNGDIVVLNALNSGVGQCVIQIAASLGIRTLCFLRDERLAPELENLGASEVFHDSPEGYEAAKVSLGERRARLAFNAVGGESALRLMKLLTEGGTHITYGAMGRKPLTVPNGPLIFRDIRIRGFWVTRWMENASRAEVETVYHALAGKLADGSLKQKVDKAFELEDFRSAISRLKDPDRNGKVLFRPSAKVDDRIA